MFGKSKPSQPTGQEFPNDDTPPADVIGAGLPRPRLPRVPQPPAVPDAIPAMVGRLLELIAQIARDVGRLAGGETTTYREFSFTLTAGATQTLTVDIAIDHWHVWTLGASTDRWSFSIATNPPGAQSPTLDGRSFLQAPGHTRQIIVTNLSAGSLTFYAVAESGVTFSIGSL